MDCNAAHVLLSLERPWASELDAAEAAALRTHVAGCADCASWVQQERQVDERLAQAICEVSVPAELRGRLLSGLARARTLQLRRRVLRVAAVAAALLIAAAVGWYVRWSLRPGVDADEIVHNFDARAANAPEKVQEWFRERYGVPAPMQLNNSPLNYRLMVWHGRGEFMQVKGVPQLVFFHQGSNPALAFIYVLSDADFNVQDTALQTAAAGSFYRVEVFREPADPHIVYVILYTGDSLAPFLLKPPLGG
jgi:hypothetical protein